MSVPQGLREAVSDHIASYLAGNVDAVLAHMAGLWQDLGAGASYSKDSLRRQLKASLEDPLWQEVRDRAARPEDLFDLGRMHVQVLDASKDAAKAAELHFAPRTGDCWVEVQPADGSPLPEPWVGVYRKEGDRWLMVAGD